MTKKNIAAAWRACVVGVIAALAFGCVGVDAGDDEERTGEASEAVVVQEPPFDFGGA